MIQPKTKNAETRKGLVESLKALIAEAKVWLKEAKAADDTIMDGHVTEVKQAVDNINELIAWLGQSALRNSTCRWISAR